jgi:TRAP-type C4-dicarboxylate transport system substrate-binding protein
LIPRIVESSGNFETGSLGSGYESAARYLTFFAKRAEELSNGEVKVEVFPAGALGSHQSCQEQVSMETLDFYITTAGMVSVFDPTRHQGLIGDFFRGSPYG